MFDYEIKFAETEDEKRQSFRLRHEVFMKELAKGAACREKEIESDVYDNYCDHLIIIDKTKNIVAGTYRLLLSEKLNGNGGFYTEKIFDIGGVKKLGNGIMELSRSCVHKDYREGLVINLLWNGIAKYIKDNGVRYLFGSVRLHTTEPKEVSSIFSLLKKQYYAPEALRVHPKVNCVFKGLEHDVAIEESKKLFLTLPPLVKGYLRLGVKVCGPPAWNPDFGSVVLCIILDIDNMSASYKRHFLGI